MNPQKILYTSVIVAYVLISASAITSIIRLTGGYAGKTTQSRINASGLRMVAAEQGVSIPPEKTVNVPLYPVVSGDKALDANNRAMIWSGRVSAGDDYFEVRIIGADDGLRVRANIIDSNIIDKEYIKFNINGFTKTATIGNIGEFNYGERCNNNRLECRGWSVDSSTSAVNFSEESAWDWSDFGGKPNIGDKWSLEIVRHDIDANAQTSDAVWKGRINWGEPVSYYGQTTDASEVSKVKLTADANIGGSTICGAPDDPDFFAKWGTRSYEGDSYQKTFANVQAQWDVADWPCYAKYILKWQNQGIPAGATVQKAELMLYRFGHSGYKTGDTATTRIRAYEITQDWNENDVAWDNAPIPRENTSYTDVTECTDDGCAADAWRKLDVTEIVKRSRVEGRDWSSAMLYTAAGQYHSGKYFYTREQADVYPYVNIYYTTGTVLADPTPTTPSSDPTPTNSFNPTPTDLPPVVTQTDVLDDFNREDEQVGRPVWAGAVTNYDIVNNELVLGGNTHTYWYSKKFDKDQTVFYTIKKIGSAKDTTSFGLLAKSQSNLGNNNLVYIAYFPKSQKLRVYTITGYQTKQLSEKSGVTFAAGDKMSLQIDAVGKLTVKRNNDVVHTFDLKGKWGSYAKDGWVGIYAKDASMVTVDDFGVGGYQGTVVATNTPAAASPTKSASSSPTVTQKPTGTVAAQPTATNAPSGPTPTRAPTSSNTYWLGMNGNDRNDGKSNQTPIRTFSHAWQILQPGDTLMIMNGRYTEPIHPDVRDGQSGAPITIKAAEDGKVIIDGQGTEIPVRFGENWGPNGNMGKAWYVLEGIVAVNGTIANIRAENASNIVIRRVSAYNASVDENSQAIAIVWSKNILVEDAIAAGTGRYMTQNFDGDNVTYRRVFTMWQRWDGRKFCGVEWPNGNNMGIYNSSNSTIENGIAYGRSLTGIFIQANDNAAVSNNNQILGSLSMLQGKDYDNTIWKYGSSTYQPTSRPGPIENPWGAPCPDGIINWEWGGSRPAFTLYGQGELQNNVFKDIIGLDSVGIGLQFYQPWEHGLLSGNKIENVTMLNNGQDVMSWELNKGGPNLYMGMDGVSNPVDSRIAGSSWANGTGARIEYRYENRKLTNIPLLPWPMQQRGLEEMGLSIESVIGAAKAKVGGANPPWPIPQGGTMLGK